MRKFEFGLPLPQPEAREVAEFARVFPDNDERLMAVKCALAHERRLMNELAAALKEARGMVSDWGAYSAQYFQDKHGFEADLVKLDQAIARAEGVPLGVESAMESAVVGAEVRAAHALIRTAREIEDERLQAKGLGRRVDGPMGLPLSRVRSDGK